MKIWAGLGNPGAQYAANRHNIGFMAVEAIAAAHGFGAWRARFNGQVAEGRIGEAKVLLLKPETYMNLSGDSVQAALAFYKLGPADLTVFHDELDLEAGKPRFKTGGGHAGHNGLRSIQAHVGPEFHRVRLGIGHPGDKQLVHGHVLGDFSRADGEWLAPLLAELARAAPVLAAGDGPGFINAVTRTKPAPRPEPRAPRAPAPGKDPEPDPEDAASALRRLAEKFR